MYRLIQLLIFSTSLLIAKPKSIAVLDFEGKDISEGFVSMTLRFTFQNYAKSLLESEINRSMQMVLKLLEKRLNAKIRS